MDNLFSRTLNSIQSAGIINAYRHAKEYALDLVFPKACLRCGSEGAWCCESCTAKIIVVPPQCFVCHTLAPATTKNPAGKTCEHCRKNTPVQYFFSPFIYQDETVRTLIQALKYERIRSLDAWFAAALADYLHYFQIVIPADALIIPIPLHRRRHRSRGFNQSELIAQALGTRLGVPVACDVLIKKSATVPQADLPRRERLTNITGSFSIAQGMEEKLHDKTVIILDDVKTTGATITETAYILKKSGARRVWALTVAH
ncbi:MAG: ComF family protein [bacterium]|nr:ComF family protein [bacterium]MDZ4299761.1 ComF family protein [Candidatus Sungbacteria bacterium]